MTHSTQPGQYPSPPGYYQPPKKSHTGRTILIVIGSVIGGIFLIGIIAVAVSSVGKNSNASGHQLNNPAASTSSSPAATASPSDKTTAPTAPQYTPAERQVIESAEGYLSDGEGFSKSGLIQQLDSKAGDGFSRKLAVFAVNHVKVNWFHQAVISARGYMHDGEGFSYNSLVQQLHSPYGEGFTLAQAKYAAKAVGL